jgi:tetratricopeptide (TPR) repeat protein
VERPQILGRKIPELFVVEDRGLRYIYRIPPASSYGQLGNLAQAQRDFAAAKAWYRQALAIYEKQGNEHGAAISYHQLGIVAQEQRDFAAAETWYRQAMAIFEKQGDEHGAASTYGDLGILAGKQGHIEESGRWRTKCILAFAHCNDPEGVRRNVFKFPYFLPSGFARRSSQA